MAGVIWQGELPPPATPNTPPPDLNNLNQYTYDQVMTYMEDFPHLAETLYRWGRSPTGLWTGLPQFPDENALVNWHLKLTPLATIPFAAGSTAVTNNIHGRHFPIDRLIRRDKIHSLRALHAAELWEPCGYTAYGISYLRFAYDVSAEMTFNYIAYAARKDVNFARAYPSAPRFHRQIFPTVHVTHLDWLVGIGEYKLFTVWWKNLDTPIGTLNRPIERVRLNDDSRRILCRTANRSMSEYLRLYTMVNLAQVDMNNMSGSVWHLAVTNPNSNFIDSIAPYTPVGSIDLMAGHMQTPLELARNLNRFNHFKKLLSVGANADQMVITELDNLPRANNKWFRAACTHYRDINPNPGGHVQGGTLIHMIIQNLHRGITTAMSSRNLTVAQKAHRRRNLAKKANALIRIVRAGSIHGRPDLTTRDESGKTAIALAGLYGYQDIYAALEMNPLPHVPIPVVAPPLPLLLPLQQPGPPIPARGHRYPTRRSRLRGG